MQEFLLGAAAAAGQERQQRAARLSRGSGSGRRGGPGEAYVGLPGLGRQANADVRAPLRLDFQRQGAACGRAAERNADLEVAAVNVTLTEKLIFVEDARRQLRFAERHPGIQAAEAEAVLVHVVAVGHLPAQHQFVAARLRGVAERLLGAQQRRFGGRELRRQHREHQQEQSEHEYFALTHQEEPATLARTQSRYSSSPPNTGTATTSGSS